MTSCERPLKSSASDLGPSVVSKVYSFSTGTQGSCRRRSASSSLRRVSSFSLASSSSRAACHSSCVPILCSVIVHSCLGGYLGRFQHEPRPRPSHRPSGVALPDDRDRLEQSRE